MTARPSFLFIVTDQHRADWLGCMGHPVLKTPNIDALARTGKMFTDFHLASPVCMPNRGVLMTGGHRLKCYRSEARGELYDLREDLDECRNPWNDAAHSVTKADLSAALTDGLANQVDASPLSQRLA